jgi:hypothetical protein
MALNPNGEATGLSPFYPRSRKEGSAKLCLTVSGKLAQYPVLLLLDVAPHQVTQETVQLDPGMIGAGQAAPRRQQAGMLKYLPYSCRTAVAGFTAGRAQEHERKRAWSAVGALLERTGAIRSRRKRSGEHIEA